MYPLADGYFAPKNQWYVAAWSSEVTRTPMGRIILDEPVAFYRKEDGGAVAVDGRCPHRSFPLGRSRVVGDNIECGYHGLQFRPDGTCAKVPSQDRAPAVCTIKSYPVVERWQWIWIWPGDPALADESLIPDHFETGPTDPRFKFACRYFDVASRYMLLNDNLLDLTHFGHLHRSAFGEGNADQVPEHTHGANWVESRFEQLDVPCPPYITGLMGYDGMVARRSFGTRFHVPGLHVGWDEIYLEGQQAPHAAVRILHAVTPGAARQSHYFWAIGHDWDHEDPEHADKIAQGLTPTMHEDFQAGVYIEEMIDLAGGSPGELLIRADGVAVLGRRLVEKMIKTENEQLPLVNAAE